MRHSESGFTTNVNLVIISVIVFAIITGLVLYCPELKGFDTDILKIIRKFLNQFPSCIPLLVTDFGRANQMLWPQISACSVLISQSKYRHALLIVLFTQGCYYLTDLIKDQICRPRPIICHLGYSFPSRHASTTMCFYGIAIYLIWKYTSDSFTRWLWITLLSLFVLLTAVSRLWLGVHFLSDVIAGLLLGLAFVNLYIILDKFFDKV